MNILIITNAYTPIISARAFRWSAIAEIWAQQGHHIDVVCCWHTGLPRNDTIKGVNVFRVGGRLSERLRGKLESSKKHLATVKKDKNKNTNNNAYSSLFAILIRMLKRLHDITWKKIYWPDYACIWFFQAFRCANKLCSHSRYDAIISVSIPFTCHLIGLRLEKNLNGVPWLVDVGDPFCFMDTTPVNNHMLYKRLNYRAEKQVFQSAKWITVTNDKTANLYKTIFPESSNKIKVIPPLFDDRIKIRKNGTKLFDKHKINLSYIGNFYKVTREPDDLLLLLRSILNQFPHFKQRLLFHIFGNTGGFEKEFEKYSDLSENVILHGSVSKDTVLRVINETDFLINIGNKTNYQIPSKIVEYAASGKPIINICSMYDDSSLLFLKDYPLIKNFFINRKYTSETIDEISQFINENINHKLSTKPLYKFLKPFLSNNIASRYYSFLFQ